jgi:hypothetical protein
MNTERTAKFQGQDYPAIRKAAKFMSFYSTTENPEAFLIVEHTSENAARKGSWQSAAMKAHWHYRGFAPIA